MPEPQGEEYDPEALLQEMNRLDERFSKASEKRDSAEMMRIAEEYRGLTAQELAHASTYKDFLNAHFHSLHPEDRILTYRKTIEHAPTKEIAQQLYYHALNNELKALALEKMDEFKEGATPKEP
jgi:hypothetical protein